MNWLANLFAFTEATWLFVIGFLAVVLLLSLVVPYFHLRRWDEASKTDPQLALKVLLHFCFSVCIFVALLGLTLLMRGFLEEYSPSRGGSGATYELGGYLFLAGAVLAAMYFASVYFGTNHRLHPAAGRVFTFWRFAVHNVVVVAAVVLLAVTLSESPPLRRPQYLEYMGRQWVFLATLLVWGFSWLAHLWLVWKHSADVAPAGKALTWEVQEAPKATAMPK